ncbi:S-layer homology domain-containing protein [Paenibacillus cymbidii]|uniref:S-layer homology domain-containing protein n=1 Tax=Paenibacillus cymbidii TaxID=1639034 RepID=UPI001F3C3106|nr:S-layer homology domain-containing protein [Paenibacillus cymbidii]
MISLFIIVTIVNVFQWLSPRAYAVRASGGMLDATQWDFSRQGVLSLRGEWEFYEGKLLGPEDFRTGGEIGGRLVQVPGGWKNQLASKDKHGYGAGTYRLLIRTNEAALYSLRAKKIRMSSRIFMNSIDLGGFFQFASSGANVPKLNIVYTTAPVQLTIPHTRIAAGDGFTLLLQNDGTVKAYGRIREHKIEVPYSLTGVQAVYASNDCGYAIREGGFVAALGDGCAVPAEVPDGNVVGLVLDGGTSAVLMNDGTIINWGREIPAEWKTIYAPFKSISGGDDHVAALTWDNAVVSWGSGSTGATSVPDDLPATTAIASGINPTVALLQDGTFRSWGRYYLEPVPEALSDGVAVEANDNFSVALKRDGHLVVWGDGEQLQPPPGLDGVIAVAAGRSHIVALKSDGTSVGWGSNRHGETVNPAPSVDGLSWLPGSEIGTTKASIADERLHDGRYGDLTLKYRIGAAGSMRQPYVGEDSSDLGYDTALQPGDELTVSPGQHIYVLAEYEEEGDKKVAYWSDVVLTAGQVKQAPDDNNNNNNNHNDDDNNNSNNNTNNNNSNNSKTNTNNGSNTPASNNGKETVFVDVVIGGEQPADTAKVEIERTKQANGTISDLVTFDEAKANEVADRAAAAKQQIARIVIPDANDEVGEVRMNVSSSALAVLQKNGIDLEIYTDNAVIRVPIASLDGWDEAFYFRLVPIREAALRQEIEQRARTEEAVRKIAGNDDIQVVARPMIIETNLSSRAITLTLPLRDVELPQDSQERAAYLKHMGIFIEHTEGDKEVVAGKTVAGADGKLGLQFDVDRFSTFTILHIAALTGAEQQVGTHAQYVDGYPDGTFGAERNVTRAELATLLVNSGIVPADLDPDEALFPDVAASHWAAANIGRAEKAGLLVGYPDGSYRADASITRAEMAAVVYRYVKPDSAPSRTFPDVPSSHWASGMIAALSGYLDGYPDLTFRPDAKLTRAEAVTILNRMLKRGPLNGGAKPSWPDVAPSYWAYADIEEASTDHAYTLRPEGGEWPAE